MTDLNDTTISTETVVTTENAATAAEQPRRSRNEGTLARLDYERNSLARKQERKAHFESTLSPELLAVSKGYANCLTSIQNVEALIAKLETQLEHRTEKQAAKAAQPAKVPGKRGPKGPQTGEKFEVVVGEDDPSFTPSFPEAPHSDLPMCADTAAA